MRNHANAHNCHLGPLSCNWPVRNMTVSPWQCDADSSSPCSILLINKLCSFSKKKKNSFGQITNNQQLMHSRSCVDLSGPSCVDLSGPAISQTTSTTQDPFSLFRKSLEKEIGRLQERNCHISSFPSFFSCQPVVTVVPSLPLVPFW